MPSYVTQWQRDLLADPNLSAAAKAVGCAVFGRYANERNRRTAYGSLTQIQKLAGLKSRTTARTALAQLSAAGWVVLIDPYTYRSAGVYKIVNPTDDRSKNCTTPEVQKSAHPRSKNCTTPEVQKSAHPRSKNWHSEVQNLDPSTDGLPIERLTPPRPTAEPAAASADPDIDALRMARPGESGHALASRLVAEARQRTNGAAPQPRSGVSQNNDAPTGPIAGTANGQAAPPAANGKRRHKRIGATPPGVTRLDYVRQVEAERAMAASS